VIKTSFYLKKKEILRDVAEWVKEAETSHDKCNYTHSLFNWQQPKLAPEFAKKGTYEKHMKDMQKELIKLLDELEPPKSIDGLDEDEKNPVEDEEKLDEPELKLQRKKSTVLDTVIDVAFDEDNGEENDPAKIDINDEAVKDRWSRYIGAMGIEAVAKQAEATVLVSGVGPLGIEIAKNVVLAGCKELILHDTQSASMRDIAGG
jgi:hypothetical protein